HSLSPSGSIHAAYTTSRGAGILRRTRIRCPPSAVMSMPDLLSRSLVSSRNVRFECLQTLLPELAVVLQPAVGLTQRSGLDPTIVCASFNFAAQHAGALERHDVL